MSSQWGGTSNRQNGGSPSVRFDTPNATDTENLGLLSDLEGSWEGTGFNLIARPDRDGGADLFLELNLTQESLQIVSIGSPVPNRGFAQGDVNLFGLTYLQKIRDATTFGALHIEPGIWINVPATTEPAQPPTIARLATIPHGNAVLAQGTVLKVDGGPNIAPVNTAPFPAGSTPPPGGTQGGFAQYDLANPASATNPRTPFGDPAPFTSLPPAITQSVVNDPTILLTSAIQGLNIVETTVIQIATAPPSPASSQVPNGGGGIENIPFLAQNADAALMFATFWIEKIASSAGDFVILQYVQTVLLNFPILSKPGSPVLSWPHVSVGTLRRSFG